MVDVAPSNTPTQNPSEVNNVPVEVPIVSPKEAGWKKWTKVLVVLLLIIGGGAYLLLNHSVNPQIAKKSMPIPTATPVAVVNKTTPTPSVNTLNPNTGNLYTDIKERLDQVIK